MNVSKKSKNCKLLELATDLARSRDKRKFTRSKNQLFLLLARI